MSAWSPTQYLKFADERTRAARDLLAHVPLKQAEVVYDLGCGPGNSTELLVEAYPSAQVVGMDSSAEMLAKARKVLPQIEFTQADLASWAAPKNADVLYSNATFQWLHGHVVVLQNLLKGLKTGGVLAVQMPDNIDEPSHASMREAGKGTAYAANLKSADSARDKILSPAGYYAALKPLCSRLDIWHTHYNHPLDGVDGIVEWLKSTGLRPYLDALNKAEQADYLARYYALLASHYPVQADGKVLLRFPRIFIVAVR